MTRWLFVIPTDTGPQPFAILFTEPACDFLRRMIADLTGIVGACAAYIPGVAS